MAQNRPSQHHKRRKPVHKRGHKQPSRMQKHPSLYKKIKRFVQRKDTKRFLLFLGILLLACFIFNELVGQLDATTALTFIWIVGIGILFLIFVVVWLFFVALKGWASRRF